MKFVQLLNEAVNLDKILKDVEHQIKKKKKKKNLINHLLINYLKLKSLIQ